MKNFPYFILFHAIWTYLGPRRWSYITALGFIGFSVGLFTLQPYFMGKFFNIVEKGVLDEKSFHLALFYLFLFFIVNPLSWLFHGPARVVERQCGFAVRQNFVQSCYRKLQKLPYAWHQNFHTGQLYDRVRKAENALEDFSGSHFRYIWFIGNLLGPVIALMLLFKWFGFACVAIVFIAAKLVNYFDKKLIPLYKESNNLSHSYAGVFSDYLANIRTIIALRLGHETEQELLQRYTLRRAPKWKEYRINEWKWFSIDSVSEFVVAILMVIALFIVRDTHGFPIGNLFMLFQYLNKFSNVFNSLGALYQDLVKNATDYKATQIIEDNYQRYLALGQITESDNASVQSWRHLIIENLCFAYEDNRQRPQALDHIHLDIKAGEKIAFVGESGSGKSTLMTVLRGLYKADKASLIVDGTAFDTLAPLASMTTLIPQDPEIFENTIRYNITFGVEHSDEEILHVCRMAAFDTVLAELPKGLESDIREKGVNLSGGQKQRLALARGIFAIQQSSLVLMDEPTSSVDTLTELQIFDRLFAEFSSKTIIASIHRLHLLSRFDTIYYIEHGRVIEKGSLSHLIGAGGAFAKLWHAYQEQQTIEAIES